MLEVVLFFIVGLALIWLIKFFVVGRGLPYGLSRAEQVQLGNALTKMSNLFEAMEKDYAISRSGDLPDFSILDAEHVAQLETAVVCVEKYNPHIVTYVLLEHIRTSMSLGNETRAMGQSVLLEHLKAIGLAKPAESFQH